MSFDSTWDVDQYKTDYECDEHWELRRNFMITHRDKFPEDRLVCLAQVFTNVEFMGCRYPSKTMELVAQLSQGVADSYRKKQETKLKRTFVKASDAAGAKVKGLKRANEETGASNPAEKQFKPAQELHSVTTSESTPDTPSSTTSNFLQRDISNGSNSRLSSRYGGVRTYVIPQPSESTDDLKTPFGRIVLFHCVKDNSSPVQILMRSATGCHVPLQFVYEDLLLGQVCCKVYLSGKVVSSGTDFTKKAAREQAAVLALRKLQQMCYTLRIKVKFLSDGTLVEKSNYDGKEQELGEDTIGAKLMRLMGWSGGGLGKDQQGIKEPIAASQVVNRAGLGISQHDAAFARKMIPLLREFAGKDDGEHDLVFSTDFSKEERKILHEHATRFGLKSRSFGKGEDRHLVVSKKISILQIVEQMIKNADYSNEKYELIKPQKYDEVSVD